MAVPGSGPISLLGLVREKQNDDYNDTTAIQGAQGGNVVGGNGTISLESCATSGSNHSPQVVMEATNTSSLLHPNSSTPHGMSEFYGYDHDASTWYHSGFYRSGTIIGASSATNWTHSSMANACAETNGPGTCAQILYTGTLANGSIIYWAFNICTGHNGVMPGADRWLKINAVSVTGGTSGCGGQYTNTTASTVNKVMQVNNSGVVSNLQVCVTLVGISVYTTSVQKKVFACGQTTNGTWYFPDVSPAVNDQVYTNSNGTSPPSAGNYGYLQPTQSGSTDYRFTVNSSGVITEVASC